MRWYITLFLIFILIRTSAQENDTNKYLQEVVPILDGKVVFSEEISHFGLTTKEVYDKLLDWAEGHFITDDSSRGRVVYTNEDQGQIVCREDEYLVFAEKALSTDRARINYQVFLFCTDNTCRIEISNISYLYPDDKTKLTAEEWITDDKALNKKRTRMYPGMGKFRIKTVDLAEKIIKDIESVLSVSTAKVFLPMVMESTQDRSETALPVTEPRVSIE